MTATDQEEHPRPGSFAGQALVGPFVVVRQAAACTQHANTRNEIIMQNQAQLLNPTAERIVRRVGAVGSALVVRQTHLRLARIRQDLGCDVKMTRTGQHHENGQHIGSEGWLG